MVSNFNTVIRGRLIEEDDHGDILENSITETAVALQNPHQRRNQAQLLRRICDRTSRHGNVPVIGVTIIPPERDIQGVRGLFVLLRGQSFYILPDQQPQRELGIGTTDLKHVKNIIVRCPGKHLRNSRPVLQSVKWSRNIISRIRSDGVLMLRSLCTFSIRWCCTEQRREVLS